MFAVVPAVKVPATPATTYWVILFEGPSTSVSLVSTLPETGVSSSVVAESSTPTGASFTAVQMIDSGAGGGWGPVDGGEGASRDPPLVVMRGVGGVGVVAVIVHV